MAHAALTRPGRRLGRVDAALSRVLRYDLSRSDLIKWVQFTRQALGVVLASVVSIAAVSAISSTKQGELLLRDALDAEARAIAGAAARAAFVPLTLEDDAALAELVESYREVGHLESLRIIDGGGSTRYELRRGGGRADGLLVTAPIRALSYPGDPKSAPSRPIGAVEVRMRVELIAEKTRRIALVNVALAGGLSLAVLMIGTLVIRNLVERLRELVGEARLVEEVRRVNEELEAFSYSVAHDLRAPLRAIDGFGQVLEERAAAKLDGEEKGYLLRVRGATRRMGQLIDDLLNLSRVTRAELRRARVDLSALAREIAAGLRSRQPERRAEFRIAEGLAAEGDPNLLRAALDNLLGNAWKYTSRRERAEIEFGWSSAERAFFVRDNGAGFDMAFAGKLFKPFSRLHGVNEFEGTGIGLATVQRIIVRHGGRIWADAAPERGAAFYFTLGRTT